MYGWRERSPIRYPASARPGRNGSRSEDDIIDFMIQHSGSRRSRGKDVLPMAEYERRKSGDNESKSLTLRAFSDGLPTAGDLRNFLTTKRSPPKQKQRGVEEHVVRDYRYPQTLHEIKMVQSNGATEEIPQLETGLTAAFGEPESSAVARLGPKSPGKKISYSTSVFQKRDIVDGDKDDRERFKEYVKRRPITGNDFDPCECGGKGVQVWMRLCGCGCKCGRCRAVVRYKRPDEGENDDEDDPLGWK